jgi:BirA family biotin operon repressor/biotin-[acetyl-CoA-carboxylase] ligase
MSNYADDIKYKLGSIKFIKSIVYYPSLNSTNTLAYSLAHDGGDEWTVIIADSQSNGRGRQGRVWYSPPGTNIYTSFILRPTMSYEYFPAISLLTGMVISIVIEHFIDLKTELKWPNDVMVNGKKISGILLELGNDSNNKPYIIVGIGININSDTKDYPRELFHSSTSMKVLTNRVFDRVMILNHLYTSFFAWYDIYCTHNGFNGIKEKYMQRFRMIDKRVHIESGAEKITGVVKDIDEYGRLVLKGTHDEIINIKSGDVHLTI